MHKICSATPVEPGCWTSKVDGFTGNSLMAKDLGGPKGENLSDSFNILNNIYQQVGKVE